jgi:diguanylate cyclase (GGDEF)-like protein/PAS domain S-box-containing protein
VTTLRGVEEGRPGEKAGLHRDELDSIVSGLDDLASAHETLDLELRRYQELFHLAPRAYLVTEPDGRITQANPASVVLLGCELPDVVGQHLVEFVAERARPEFLDRLVQFRLNADPAEWEVPMRQNGQSFIAWVAVAGGRAPTGDLRSLHWLLQDITERRRSEDLLAHRATHDSLTGLANRSLFDEGLELALARAARSGAAVAVLSLDLDKFKLVNDSLGHPPGDEVLRQVASRLASAARATDIVARIGGDEFMVLLADLDLAGGRGLNRALLQPETVAERIRQALRAPFPVVGVDIHMTVSVGVSVFPTDAGDGPSLLRRADEAMYRSKESAQGGYVLLAGDGATIAALAERHRESLALKRNGRRASIGPGRSFDLTRGKILSAIATAQREGDMRT